MLNITTPRLDLVPATVELLDAELEAASSLASFLDAWVPDGWPPGEYDRRAIEFFRARLAEDPEAVGWYGWYALLRAGHGHPRTLVGNGGFCGPPSPNGLLEIGYSVVPAFEGRGFATELVRALVSHAFKTPGVSRVIAHTHPENIGSIKVLERSDFLFAGPGGEPGTVQFAGGSRMTLDEFFSGYEESRPIFDALREAIEALGPVEVRVTKSQVAFWRAKAFAWAWVPDRYLRGRHAPLVLTLPFTERDASPRWKQIVEPAPGRFTHHLELCAASEIDDEVRCWLRKAWEAAV